MPQYALLDTTQHARFYTRLDKIGIPYASLFDGHAEQSLRDIAPLLIEHISDRPGDAFIWQQLPAMGTRTPTLSLLESPLTLPALAEHLRRFHLVDIPEGKELLLRWYDTRILPVWLDILTPSQRAGFLAPIQSWHYFDRYGQRQSISCAISDDNAVMPSSPPYRLDQQQYDTLLRASEPDQVIAQLRRIIPNEIHRLSYAALYPFVKHHTQAATHYGASNIDEQVQYVLVALYTNGHCVEHSDFVQRKADLVQSTEVAALSDWLQTLPDAVWETGHPLWEMESRL